MDLSPAGKKSFSVHPNMGEKLQIAVLGMNHTTASVDLRECLVFFPENQNECIDLLKACSEVHEVIFLSTCNRVEILFTAKNVCEASSVIKQYLAQSRDLPIADFENSLYFHQGDEAVRHLFRVASSLDSMVLGEPQILGQIKTAYKMATEVKSTGVLLNRLMHKAFSVAKRIRTETGIGDNAVSISYAAIELGRKIFGSLENKKILLIGAGEMAELAVEHLIRHRAGTILVANRTFQHGLELADRFQGKALAFEEIPEYLKEVDIVVSSTGAPGFIIFRDQVKKIMRARKNRTLFFIDIAVPRDIDPEINRIQNCYVYDIDDLKEVVDENLQDRRQEALKAERIIDEAVIRFAEWYDSLGVVATIVDLKCKIETIAAQELCKTMKCLPHLSETDRTAVERMVQSLVKKILHDPMNHLKNSSHSTTSAVSLDVTRKLFNLDR
jgi:glutamyl-tRNA reductase